MSYSKLLGIYDVLLGKSKIDPKLLLAPITLQEAIQSTRIEGTQVTLDDMLEYGADESKINTDIKEVVNYSTALRTGENLLKSLHVSTRLIKKNAYNFIIWRSKRGES